MFFDDLDLSHKATRERVRKLLDGIEERPWFSRKDLDRLCGQRNKPLGAKLRLCFMPTNEKTAMRNGEVYEYEILTGAVAELTVLLTRADHDVIMSRLTASNNHEG